MVLHVLLPPHRRGCTFMRLATESADQVAPAQAGMHHVLIIECALILGCPRTGGDAPDVINSMILKIKAILTEADVEKPETDDWFFS